MKLKRVSLAVAVVAICGLAVAGFALSYPVDMNSIRFPKSQFVEVSPVENRITVQVERAKATTSWVSHSYYSGIVKAKRKSELSFERAGRIDKILVDKGDRVEKGQLLASLNSEIIEAQIRKLTADKAAASAVLAEMIAGPRKETIEAARASVRELDAQLDLARRSHERRKGLANTASISKEDLDQSQTAIARFEAARANAQKTLEDLELGTRKEKIENQKASIASLDESIASARIELAHSSIHSPYSGTIVDRLVHEGVVVPAATPAFIVNEDTDLEVYFGIPPNLIEALSEGMDLRLSVRDKEIKATLKSIVPQVDDETRTLRAIAVISTNDCAKVYPGDIAKLELARNETTAGVWLNMAIVMQGQRGLWECYVVEPIESDDCFVVKKRAIEILHTEGDRVLVRGAIHDGDLVLTSAANRLVVGQRVNIETQESR